MLDVKTSFYPIRLVAYQRNDVEMEVTARNASMQPLWIESDIKMPEAISLAPDKQLGAGRLRLGIAMPNGGTVKKKVKIYGGAASYPDNYRIMLTVFAFAQDGVIAFRQDFRTELRCLRFGEE